jgi:Uma2 family endonuclease
MVALMIDPAPLPRMSLAEWAALPEDEDGELVDGCLVEEEVAELTHEAIVSWLIGALRLWAIVRGGFVFGSELKLAVRPRHGRKPDVSVYLPGDPTPRGRSLVRVPPGIIVEVISKSPRDVRRDRIEKPDEYAAFGVRFYWLIDPVARTLEIFELAADGRYVRALGAAQGTIDVPGCAELKLDLDALWAEVDRLPPEEEDEER